MAREFQAEQPVGWLDKIGSEMDEFGLALFDQERLNNPISL